MKTLTVKFTNSSPNFADFQERIKLDEGDKLLIKPNAIILVDKDGDEFDHFKIKPGMKLKFSN